MAGLGLFPEGGMALIYTVIVILVIAFIWLLFENPRMALNIAEGFFRALFYIVKAVVMALWAVASWIGKFIAGLWR